MAVLIGEREFVRYGCRSGSGDHRKFGVRAELLLQSYVEVLAHGPKLVRLHPLATPTVLLTRGYGGDPPLIYHSWPMSRASLVRLESPEQSRLPPQCFSPDGTRLIAWGHDTGSLHVWNLQVLREELGAGAASSGTRLPIPRRDPRTSRNQGRSRCYPAICATFVRHHELTMTGRPQLKPSVDRFRGHSACSFQSSVVTSSSFWQLRWKARSRSFKKHSTRSARKQPSRNSAGKQRLRGWRTIRTDETGRDLFSRFSRLLTEQQQAVIRSVIGILPPPMSSVRARTSPGGRPARPCRLRRRCIPFS